MVMSNNFVFENEQAVVTADFNFGEQPLDPAFNPNLVAFPTLSSWGIGNPLTLIASFIRQQQFQQLDSNTQLVWQKGTPLNTSYELSHDDSFVHVDSITSVITSTGTLAPIDVSILLAPAEVKPIDVSLVTFRQNVFEHVDVSNELDWDVPPPKDTVVKLSHRSVNLYGDRGVRPDYRYFTSVDFYFKGEQANVTPNFVDPISFDKQRVRLVPVNMGNTLDAGKKQRQVDFYQRLYWGYSLNNFVIGGSILLPNDNNDTSPPDEVIEHPDYEVFRIVNVVNIVKLPEREVISFDNFSIGLDSDSFCWSANFNIVGQRSYDLLKPAGRNLSQLEVSINGKIFSLFVANVGRSLKNGSTTYRASAYSPIKLLSFPYAPRRTFTQTSVRTSAQLVTDELNGSGLLLDWRSPSWEVAANIHSYQDKTSMGAILDVVNSIDSVVQPSADGTTVVVRPRFPVSPWDWDTAIPDHSISISQFISVDESNVPKDNPNRTYIYGTTSDGVGARVTRQGTSGDKLVESEPNKYMTADSAAVERGRMVIAKNSYLNTVRMVTYVDTSLGLFFPLDLVEFTEGDGSKWRGQVTSINIVCQRQGTALLQELTVLRYYP